MTTTPGARTDQEAVVRFTEQARERVKGFMESRGKQSSALRVSIQGRSSSGFRYAMNIVDPNDREETDVEIDGGGFIALIDAGSVDNLRGATIDFVEGEQGSGFQIDNPNPVWADDTAMLVQNIIDTQINPGIASHGGFIELLDVKDGVAYIFMGGGCQGCGMADVTLKQGIEGLIREAVPQVTSVVDQTDHAAGSNPYYRPSK